MRKRSNRSGRHIYPFIRSGNRWSAICTAAFITTIYATLGLAETLSGKLRNEGLLAITVFVCLIIVVAIIIMQGLRARPAGREIGVALGIVVVYCLFFVRMATTLEERTHRMEYGVVAVFMYEALKERLNQGRRVPFPAPMAILLTSLAGAIDEGIQFFLPRRVFDPMDLLFNFLAGLMAVTAMVVLGWAKKRTKNAA